MQRLVIPINACSNCLVYDSTRFWLSISDKPKHQTTVALPCRLQLTVPSTRWRGVPQCSSHSNSASGRQVALVGRSGSGKSTLAMALFEMSDLLEGSIKVDGQNLSSMPLHTIRSRLALIPQEPLLFSGTVRSV